MSAYQNITLPDFLHPGDIDTLARVGRNNDGGYLVDRRSINASEVLMGFGVNDDWSFEKQFTEEHEIPIYVFDATVSQRIFFKKIFFALPRIDNPRILMSRLRTYWRYISFFKGANRHIEKNVGMDAEPDYVSVSTIRKNILPSESKNIFLKIDIEGWEYRILDELLEMSELITGLVIEFHDVDLHMHKIEHFVSNFSLNLCHAHGNNYALISEQGTPLVIELTFTKFKVKDALAAHFPNEIDMPNNPHTKEYVLSFS